VTCRYSESPYFFVSKSRFRCGDTELQGIGFVDLTRFRNCQNENAWHGKCNTLKALISTTNEQISLIKKCFVKGEKIDFQNFNFFTRSLEVKVQISARREFCKNAYIFFKKGGPAPLIEKRQK